MALNVGELFASLSLNMKEFEDGLRNAQSQMADAGKGFDGITKAIGVTAVAGGAAIAGGFVAAVMGADNMKQALNGLQASTGASKDEMAGMEGSLKAIYGANYGQSFDDIAQAMATVKQNTGESGSALEALTKNALVLRDTFDMDVNESTRAAKSMMEQFGISSEQAFNLIAQGAQNGANKNGDLLDSLNEYAPQFQAMGFSADQFTNVLIDGAKNGAFSIDKVGDAMKEFNIRSKDGSKTSAEGFAALGLNAADMSTKFAAGGSTAQAAFKQVMDSLTAIKDPMTQNAAGVALFGTQFEDLGIKGIAAFANIGTTANSSTESMKAIDGVKYDNLGAALEGIGRQLMLAMQGPIQETIMPLLNQLATWFQANLPTIQSTVTTVFTVVGDIIRGAAEVVKFLLDNMNLLLPVIGGVVGAFVAFQIISGITTVVGLFNTALAAMRAGTLMATLAQWGFNTALLANPITWIVVAIGLLIAAVVAIWMNWDTVSKALTASWEWIKGIATSIFGGIATFLSTVWEGIKNVISTVWNGIMDFFKQWGLTILIVLTGPIGILVALLIKYWDDIKAGAMAVWNAIKDFFSATMDFIKNIFTSIWDGIKTAITVVWDAIKTAATVVWDGIKTYFTTVLNFYKTLFETIWNGIKTALDTVWNGIKTAAETVWNAIKSFFDTTLNGIKTVFSTVWEAIKTAITTVINAIKTTIETVWNAIKSTISGIVNGISSTVSSVFNTISSTISGIWNGIKSTTSSVWEGIKSAITTPIEKAKSVVLGIIESIKKAFNFNLKLPDLKLPHVSVDMKKNSWGIPYPDFKVNWYKNGGVFGGPSVVGLGEAGKEAVIPLSGSQMMPFAKAIASQMPGGNGGSGIVIQNMSVRNDNDIKLVAKELYKLQSNENRGRGTRL